MFPFEDGDDGAGWDDYGGPVRPGDFGASGLPAGAPRTFSEKDTPGMRELVDRSDARGAVSAVD